MPPKLIDVECGTVYNQMMDIHPASTPRSAPRLLALIAFLILYTAWLLRGQDLAWERFWVGNLTIIFSSAVAAYLAWRAFLTSPSSSHRRSWLAITLGLSAWFLLNSLHIIPANLVVSGWPALLVRMIYLLGGISIWVGISRFPRQTRSVLSMNGLVIDAIMTSVALVLLLWKAWVEPLLSNPVTIESLVLVYILVDLFTLILILNVFLFSRVENLTSALLWVFLAALTFSFSDMSLIAQIRNAGSYTAGTVMDLGWVVGNLALIVAITIQSHNLQFTRPVFINRILQRSQSLLPIVSILLLGWYALINWQLYARFDSISLWGTAILGLGLLVRQGFQAGENALEQYARLVNSIAEPAFVCDEQGRLRLVNSAFLGIMRSPNERQSGKSLITFFQLNPQETHWLKELLRQTGPGIEIDSSRELVLINSDQQQIPVALTLRSIEAGSRQHLAFAGTIHDLRLQKQQQADLLAAYSQVEKARNELEQLNSRLEQMVNEKTHDLQNAYRILEEQNKTLQQLDQLKSDFVSLVSHELRAPLTNIRGGIELLLATPNQEPQRLANTLARVQAEILRLSRFTETILDLSALDANRLPLYPEPLDLKTVCIDLQTYFDQAAGGERIQWQIAEPAPILLADQKALHSVLFHLLDNAIKYAPEGPIIVTSTIQDEAALLSVVDEGPGIDDEVLPFIFERFYRANMADSQTIYGHGLGLYMVKRFIEAMNGSVQAKKADPHGTLFIVRIPLHRE